MVDENGATRATAAAYLLASKRCDIRGLEELLRAGRLVVTVSHLVHALQRERGASKVYLASGPRFAHDFPGLGADSDTGEADFRGRVAAWTASRAACPGAAGWPGCSSVSYSQRPTARPCSPASHPPVAGTKGGWCVPASAWVSTPWTASFRPAPAIQAR